MAFLFHQKNNLHHQSLCVCLFSFSLHQRNYHHRNLCLIFLDFQTTFHCLLLLILHSHRSPNLQNCHFFHFLLRSITLHLVNILHFQCLLNYFVLPSLIRVNLVFSVFILRNHTIRVSSYQIHQGYLLLFLLLLSDFGTFIYPAVGRHVGLIDFVFSSILSPIGSV